MQDRVELYVAQQRIENFISYSITADIYTPADAFSLEVANPEIEIKVGQRCELYINGQLELTGIIDKTQKSYDKSAVKYKIEGRDLMGLLVDCYCEEFFTAEGMPLKALAERLLKRLPFINRKNIIYQENIKGSLKKKKSRADLEIFDIPHNFAQIEPGQTVFDVLKTYAMSRGLMFFAMPDGTMVFGKPKSGGQPVYKLICKKSDPSWNNVIEAEKIEDISERYSKITVIGQQQGLDIFGTDAKQINTAASLIDDTFPFYKPYVTKDNNDARSPKLRAQMLLEQMRFKGFQLQYKVAGHSQEGKNWSINEICHVEDEVFRINDSFLIYSRTFEMSKQGVFTVLKLSYPGVVL